MADGIDFEVQLSWKWQRLTWEMGVTLFPPLEVRNETELAVVADLARSLILGKANLEGEFHGYHYGGSRLAA